jgi:hypothetical protein
MATPPYLAMRLVKFIPELLPLAHHVDVATDVKPS